jgi:hypothetical protein
MGGREAEEIGGSPPHPQRLHCHAPEQNLLRRRLPAVVNWRARLFATSPRWIADAEPKIGSKSTRNAVLGSGYAFLRFRRFLSYSAVRLTNGIERMLQSFTKLS